ncbi:hypothetical protein M5E06_17920 [Azospirillum sp. A1-3]|uniref:hypothetical protein n=1 Tax=Azospirillum sp. A1-3 TaxID=185874 RepID=UPI002077063A|nr:hypothetical protein [Azospirillum sp. A1-3]MCM8736014.1 hypothetical protein [Azospirillum sp. A1-3]
MTILLFEATVYDPVSAGSKTILAGTSAYAHPSAPDFYRGAILGDAEATATISRTVWQSESEYGAGKLDLAEIDVENIDGWLDWLVTNAATYGFSGRLLLLPDATTAYGSATVLATGVIEGAAFSWDRVTFRWRDQIAYLLDKAAQSVKFAGSNALPAGLEGVDDIKDQWKPEWWGTNYNVPLVCVNTSKVIYQASARAMQTLSAVYDKGSALTPAGTFSTLADVQNDAVKPAAGQWKWYSGPEGTYVRLNTAPAGEVTADGSEGANGAARTIAQVWKRMLAAWGITTVSASDVTAADTAQPGEVGIWLGASEEQRRDTINKVLASGGFVTWLDAGGTWRIARVEEPTGTSSVTFKVLRIGSSAQANDGDILEWEWDNPGDGTASPAYSVALTYARNWTVQSKDSLAGISLESTATTHGLQFLTEATRQVKQEDAATLTNAPLARQTTEDTLFIDQAVTSAEASSRLAQRKKGGPRRARMKVKFGPATAAAVDLMKFITIQLPRFGMSAGRKALVTGITPDWSNQTADLYLYL